MSMINEPTGALGANGLKLTALAVSYVRLVAGAAESEPQTFVYNILRILPALYTGMLELKPYGDDEGGEDYDNYDTGAILGQLTEEQYVAVAGAVSTLFGQYDTYLDSPAEDMRYSETPVAVSLSEQLADIYQAMADFATTIAEAPAEGAPDVLADLKYRFHSYLADTICTAVRACNLIYQSKVLITE